MEARGFKMAMALVLATFMVGFWVSEQNILFAEGAIGIELNPCTLTQCVSECKKALQQKYQSATCANNGSQRKLCICLG